MAEKTLSILNANMLKARRGKLRLIETWSVRDKIYFLINEAEAPHLSPKPTTLIEAVDKYIQSRLDNKIAYNTVQRYTIHLQNAVEFFGAKTSVDKIAKRDVKEWVLDQYRKKITNRKRRDDRVSTKTVDKRVNALKRMLKWLSADEPYSGDVDKLFSNIEYPKQSDISDEFDWQPLAERINTLELIKLSTTDRKHYEKVFLEKEELARFISVLGEKLADGTPAQKRLYCAVCFATYTSARRSEITRVRKQDIDLEHGTVRLTLLKGRGSKAYRYHEFPLHQDLIEPLRDHVNDHPHEALFTSDDAHLDGTGFDEKEVKETASWRGQHLKMVLKGTEFEYTSGWHIHRHSMISLLGEINNRELVMHLVGHQTEMVHLGYRHSSMSAKAEALQGIDLGVSEGKRGTGGVRNNEATI